MMSWKHWWRWRKLRMESNTRSQTKARLIVLAVFAIGFLAGALAMNLYSGITTSDPSREEHNHKPQDYIIEKMTTRLKLTPDQRDQIKGILDETFDKYADIRKDIEPRIDVVRQQGRDRMRAALSPEQLPEFEELVRESDRRREQFNDKNKR